ncbi:MAG TPA: ABC transporter substrate-binding protein [Mycobacteriales bacterium]|nr:ABC transporter substrate-binding protein [Mycobacteriales bacterium]
MRGLFDISRRKFLYGAALSAGSAAIGACSSNSSGKVSSTSPSGTLSGGAAGPVKIGGQTGSAEKPIATPASFNESPALKKKDLPPVDQRLPEKPLVLPHHWAQRGRYGGTINTVTFTTTGVNTDASIREFYYGFSPLRWLNDGITVGPGTADKWSPNKDASVWTIHFRKGLKWSDGHPFSVDDVLFWYEDITLPGHDAQTVPPDCLSAKNNPCKMTKVDDSTLKMVFDSPQPLVPDYLAAWVKGNIGGTYGNGPVWMYPKHYMKQFHPKYNKGVPKSWDQPGGLWEQKADWMRNPDCPTLTGYRCKSFSNQQGVVLERNPYYYVVTKDGDQLPYIDEINVTAFQDPQTLKLQVTQGKTDYCHGPFNQISLADVSTLSRNADDGDYKVVLWDSGSGTGSIFFLNLDYPEKKYRDLFNDKRFIRAISYAWNRKTANKTLYFQTGEITTGTMSPKAIEFLVNAKGKKTYADWRDSYKEHDLDKAKTLFKEIGLKDKDGDGYLDFPDGSKLSIEIPYSSDIPDTEAAKDDQLVNDLKKAGLRMVRRPIPAQAYPDQWNAGKLMSRTNWEVGDGPNCLVYPQWLVPLEPTRWAPLQGMYYSQLGTPAAHTEKNVDPWKRHPPRRAPVPGSPVDKLTKIYNETKRELDAMKRNELVWKMARAHIQDGPFFIGPTANYPQVITHHKDLMNVPNTKNLAQHGFVNPWVVPSPAVYDPECWFWSNPGDHV